MELGLRVHYDASLSVLHPPPPENPTRHAYSTYFGARNRVWLARRHLPLPLGVVFVLSFALRTIPRMRSRDDVHRALRGYRAGLRSDPGPRRVLRARTIWRMTRAGRPPVI